MIFFLSSFLKAEKSLSDDRLRWSRPVWGRCSFKLLENRALDGNGDRTAYGSHVGSAPSSRPGALAGHLSAENHRASSQRLFFLFFSFAVW